MRFQHITLPSHQSSPQITYAALFIHPFVSCLLCGWCHSTGFSVFMGPPHFLGQWTVERMMTLENVMKLRNISFLFLPWPVMDHGHKIIVDSQELGKNGWKEFQKETRSIVSFSWDWWFPLALQRPCSPLANESPALRERLESSFGRWTTLR